MSSCPSRTKAILFCSLSLIVLAVGVLPWLVHTEDADRSRQLFQPPTSATVLTTASANQPEPMLLTELNHPEHPLFSSARVLEFRHQADGGENGLLWLLESEESKYPVIRMESLGRTADGVGGNSDVIAMVGDHCTVRLKPNADLNDFRHALHREGMRIRKKLTTPDNRTYLIQTASESIDAVPQMIENLEHQYSQVEYAEPDYYVFATATSPNDPSFAGDYWGLNNTGQTGGTPDADIDAPEAWSLTTGSSDVIVGVIDSGIDYTHPDLAPNIWMNPGEIADNGIDDDGNGYIDDVYGWDFVDDDNDPLDEWLHGTHVAGTAGAKGNNGQFGTGVAWDVKLVPIRAIDFFTGGGGGVVSDAVQAIYYATAVGARVTTNSYGGQPFSLTMLEALRDAEEQGVLFVASSGNETRNNDDRPRYPSSYQVANVVAVGASEHQDDNAVFEQPPGFPSGKFSNIGKTSVDLVAPGNRIYSTYPSYVTDAMSSQNLPTNYHWLSGTSMAVPHVAGVAALLLSMEPDLTAPDLKALLLEGVDVLPGLREHILTSGRLNAHNSLVLLQNSRSQSMPVLIEMTVLDNGLDGSIGNGDGVPNPGETLSIQIQVHNPGGGSSENMVCSLGPGHPHPDVTIPVSVSTATDLAPSEGKTIEPFLVQLSDEMTDTSPVELEIMATDDSGHVSTRELVLHVTSKTPVHRWVSTGFDSTSLLRDVVPSPTVAGTLYALTQSNLYRSLDGGDSWTILPDLVATATAAGVSRPERLLVDIDDPMRLFASGIRTLGTGLPLYMSEDAGVTWQLVSTSIGGNPFQNSSTGEILLIADKVHRSTDHGQTWTTENGAVPASGSKRRTLYLPETDEIFVFEDPGFGKPGITTDLLLWKYIAENNWVQTESLPGITDKMKFRDIAAVAQGTFDRFVTGEPDLLSEDGGLNWHPDYSLVGTDVGAGQSLLKANLEIMPFPLLLRFGERIEGAHNKPTVRFSMNQGKSWSRLQRGLPYEEGASAKFVTAFAHPVSGEVFLAFSSEGIYRLEMEMPANTLPDIADTEYRSTNSSPITFSLPGLDVDGDEVSYGFTQPDHGSLRLIGRNLSAPHTLDYLFTPTAGFTGTSTIDITAHDGFGTFSKTYDFLVTSGNLAPQIYSEWAASIVWQGQDASEQGNPDGDWASNWLEYAMRTDPLTSDVGLAPSFSIEGNQAQLDFRRNTQAVDILWSLQSSEDLSNWLTRSPGQGYEEMLLDADVDGDQTAELVRYWIDLSTSPQEKLFLRLEVD